MQNNVLWRAVILQRNKFSAEVTFEPESSLKGFMYESQDGKTSERTQKAIS